MSHECTCFHKKLQKNLNIYNFKKLCSSLWHLVVNCILVVSLIVQNTKLKYNCIPLELYCRVKKATSLFPTWTPSCMSLPTCERSMVALQHFKSMIVQQGRNWARENTAAALCYRYFLVIPSCKGLLCSSCFVSLEHMTVSEWEQWRQFDLVRPSSHPLPFNGTSCTQVSIKLVARKCAKKKCTCQPNIVILTNATKSCRYIVLTQHFLMLKSVSFPT